MKSRSDSRRLTAAVRRQLELAGAVAREEVHELHARRAEVLVRLSADRVPAARMLEIYARLHTLPEADAAFVSTRVLATLGRRVGGSVPLMAAPSAPSAPSEPAAEPEPAESLLQVLRRRLRGRVHMELRRDVELAVGATEVALLRLHTRHALRFVEILLPTGEPVSDAVHLYCEMVAVRSPSADVLSWYVLDRLAGTRPELEDAASEVGREAVEELRPSPRRALPGVAQAAPRLPRERTTIRRLQG
jgi:hypothetical protein